MYTGTRDKVVTPDGNSEEFDILVGVLQGDTLAPFLFIIVLDYALRQVISAREQELGFTITPRRSRRLPAVVITDLDYADDISLLSDRVEQAQELLTRVETECAKIGLRLNAKKTEVITYNILPDHPPLLLWKKSMTSNTWAHGSTRQSKTLEWGRRLHGRLWTAWLCVELQPLPTYQAQLLLCNCRVCSPFWLWMLDPEAHPAEVPGWVLHQNAASSIKHQPERARYQQASVWEVTKGAWENSSQENEAGRSLPETSRAPNQQTGAVGANTRTLITRASHSNVRRRIKDRCRGGKYWRASPMHGGSRWLRTTEWYRTTYSVDAFNPPIHSP